MPQPSQALRQAVLQAIVCAQSAATIYKLVTSMGSTYDAFLKDEMKKISEAAYAASAHAWMAMIAMSSNQLEIAQSAARAAYSAEQAALQRATVFNLLSGEVPHQHDHSCDLPDEHGLNRMWYELCASLPDEFPVPDNLDQSFSLVFNQHEGNL
jgi:hypothetical protein